MNRDDVVLAWDLSKQYDIDHYLVDIKKEGDIDYQPLGRVTGNQNTFICDSLEQGVPYKFRVRSRNRAGTSLDYTELRSPVTLEPTKGNDGLRVYMVLIN